MQNINGIIKPEIGYHIKETHQRRGYGKEAAGAVINWAFSHTPFQMLYSYMKSTNIPSQATAASIGMKKVDEFSDSDGGTTYVYALHKQTQKRR